VTGGRYVAPSHLLTDLSLPHLVPLLIRGINNLSDARYCAGMGADKLTFVLDPALPGYLEPKTVKELAGWITGVELIGEFDQLSAHAINALAAECALDAVLLRSFRTSAELAEIAPPVYLELLPEFVGSDQPFPASPVGFVIELGDHPTTEMLNALGARSQLPPLWLGPGLDATRAMALANGTPLAGLVFPSGNEVKPGLRDFDQLEAVFDALEID